MCVLVFVSLFVCNQINVKTAEPVGHKFCVGPQYPWPISTSKFNLTASTFLHRGKSSWVSALYTQCPGDTVQTVTGKVDPARKFNSRLPVTVHRDLDNSIIASLGLWFYLINSIIIFVALDICNFKLQHTLFYIKHLIF